MIRRRSPAIDNDSQRFSDDLAAISGHVVPNTVRGRRKKKKKEEEPAPIPNNKCRSVAKV
eukprot:2418294-Karenia_brevis.AAC.1